MNNILGLRKLDDEIFRLGSDLRYVDIVQLRDSYIRIGTMPDVSKALRKHGIRDDYVLLPDFEVSQAGDNRTGEEFVCWNSVFFGMRPRKYVGLPEQVMRLYEILDNVFSYYFDDTMCNIERKEWLKDLFMFTIVESDIFELSNQTRVDLSDGNIRIFEGKRPVYDRDKLKPGINVHEIIETQVNAIPRDRTYRDNLEVVVVGSGNGLAGSPSSFLVRYGDVILWIDPTPHPHQFLGRLKINWDDITDILITHNHEDHIMGFSACLIRKIDQGKTLSLLTTREILRVLDQQFGDLFYHGITSIINFIELRPGHTLNYGGAKIESRLNHHILPYGTLGLKVSFNGETIGISGDTKFDTKLNKCLGREELFAEWFEECGLIFHEVDFETPSSVHSYYKEVKKLIDVLSGLVLTYHTYHPYLPPLPVAKEGQCYRVRKRQIELVDQNL